VGNLKEKLCAIFRMGSNFEEKKHVSPAHRYRIVIGPVPTANAKVATFLSSVPTVDKGFS
jgi:hypothetical protein